MKCTGKEWDYCNVEKMGCEGCYYNEDKNRNIEILEGQLKQCKRHLENYEKDYCLTSVYYELKEYAEALEHLIKEYKELEEENKIIKGNYYTLSEDIQMVTTELGFPEDTIIADEMIPMIKEKYIEKSLVEEKIEEYFEDEKWLVEHDLRALCDDEKECREYYTNKKIALKDIKKAILDKLNKLLKNY